MIELIPCYNVVHQAKTSLGVAMAMNQNQMLVVPKHMEYEELELVMME